MPVNTSKKLPGIPRWCRFSISIIFISALALVSPCFQSLSPLKTKTSHSVSSAHGWSLNGCSAIFFSTKKCRPSERRGADHELYLNEYIISQFLNLSAMHAHSLSENISQVVITIINFTTIRCYHMRWKWSFSEIIGSQRATVGIPVDKKLLINSTPYSLVSDWNWIPQELCRSCKS
jgi:hypothetical protein